MTRRTIEGQALDIGWARDGRYDISPRGLPGHGHAQDGPLLGRGAPGHRRHHRRRHGRPRWRPLRSYGLDTGLAFQIQDDLLNLIGSEESTKKDFRSDITEGKRTLVVVHALAERRPRGSASALSRSSPSKREGPGGARRGGRHHAGRRAASSTRAAYAENLTEQPQRAAWCTRWRPSAVRASC